MSSKKKSARRPARSLRALLQRVLRRTLIMLVVFAPPLAFGLGGIYYYFTSARYVGTENAYVKSEKIAVSADVSGRVVVVAVGENQQVQIGQLLFQLDPEPFRIIRERARARLAKVRQDVDELRALYRQKRAEGRLTGKDAAYYQREFDRQQGLKSKGLISAAKFDETRRNLQLARERSVVIQHDLSGILARLGGSDEADAALHPQVREAQAALEQAALDLRYTAVRAPAAGVVSNFDLQVGEFFEAGSPAFSLVGTEQRWFQANFKETELTHLREGQPATIELDAYPDGVFKARVVSISPATGAEFALLPPQNASGNWVKVVQRLPVRLELDEGQQTPPLRAGMSVQVRVDTGNEAAAPEWLRRIFLWMVE